VVYLKTSMFESVRVLSLDVKLIPFDVEDGAN